MGRHLSTYCGLTPLNVLWADTSQRTVGRHLSRYCGQTSLNVLWADTSQRTVGRHLSKYCGQTPLNVLWADTSQGIVGRHLSTYCGQTPLTILWTGLKTVVWGVISLSALTRRRVRNADPLLMGNQTTVLCVQVEHKESRKVQFSSCSSRSSDGNSSLLDEGGSTSRVPQATVELAGYGSVVWPDSLSEWLVDGAGLQ